MSEFVIYYAKAGWATLVATAILVFFFFFFKLVTETIHQEWELISKREKTNFFRVLIPSFFVAYYVCRYVLELYP